MAHLIKINLPGGFVSAGDLYEILLIAENAGARHIRFGNRQQLYFTIEGNAPGGPGTGYAQSRNPL